MKHVVMALCALALAAPGRAQDVSGTWQLTVTTEQRGPRTTSMTIKKDGDKLSGTLIGPQSAVIALTGTQTGPDVALSFTVETQDGPLAIAMKGRQDGDTMKGSLQIGSDGQGDWTASRSGALSSAATTVNLTGTWTLEVMTDAGTRTPSVTFEQDGEKLGGRYRSQLGEAPISGQIKGDAFSFQVTLPIEGIPMTILYTGTADRDAVRGKVTVADTEVGTFTGKKQN